MKVLIGVDPHKGSVAVAAIEEALGREGRAHPALHTSQGRFRLPTPALGLGDLALRVRTLDRKIADLNGRIEAEVEASGTTLTQIFGIGPILAAYTCPAGETLRRRGHDHRGGNVRYAAKASACKECPLKSKCTKGPKGRWVSRSLEDEYLERVRAYRETEAYTKALRKRAMWIEPLFGEAK